MLAFHVFEYNKVLGLKNGDIESAIDSDRHFHTLESITSNPACFHVPVGANAMISCEKSPTKTPDVSVAPPVNASMFAGIADVCNLVSASYDGNGRIGWLECRSGLLQEQSSVGQGSI